MKTIKIFATLCAFFALSSSPAMANDDKDIYQVEIIAFTIADNEAHNNNEQFPMYPALPDYENITELEQEGFGLNPVYSLLPRNKLQLNREENLISKKPRYQVLFHSGWLQQVGNEMKVHLSNADTEDQTEAVINGTIKIKRGYYYYVDINLDFLTTASSNQHYVLTTQRKLKSNELNFIDHPKFGLLIEIFPLEKKTKS